MPFGAPSPLSSPSTTVPITALPQPHQRPSIREDDAAPGPCNAPSDLFSLSPSVSFSASRSSLHSVLAHTLLSCFSLSVLSFMVYFLPLDAARRTMNVAVKCFHKYLHAVFILPLPAQASQKMQRSCFLGYREWLIMMLLFYSLFLFVETFNEALKII